MEECGCDHNPACKRCGGSGEWVLADRCPLQIIDRNTWATIEQCVDARSGGWPVNEGTLNETQAFMDAYRLVNRLIPRHF